RHGFSWGLHRYTGGRASANGADQIFTKLAIDRPCGRARLWRRYHSQFSALRNRIRAGRAIDRQTQNGFSKWRALALSLAVPVSVANFRQKQIRAAAFSKGVGKRNHDRSLWGRGHD